MYNNPWGMGPQWGMHGGWGPEWWMVLAALAPFVIVTILWSVFWKGLSLWHSARRGQYWWFLALLVINTFGILEIIYIFFIAKIKFKDLFSARTHLDSVHHDHAHHEHHH